MSVDVLISPRISFSHDIDFIEEAEDEEEDEERSSITIEAYPCSSPFIEPATEFDFAFRVDNQGFLVRESSTADELFSDGKLMPTSIDFAAKREITDTQKKKEEKKIIKSLKEHLEDSTDIEDEEEGGVESPPPQATATPSVIRALWKFRRSYSFNGGSYSRNRAILKVSSKLKLLARSKSTGGGEASLSAKPIEEEKPSSPSPPLTARRSFRIRRSSSLNCDGNSLGQGSLTHLGRSNSTGSAPSTKQIGISNEKKDLKKQNSARSCSSSGSAAGKKKGQGRRSFKDFYEDEYGSERVSPILHLPSPYISRASVDLLGFCSLFCNGKHRKKKRE